MQFIFYNYHPLISKMECKQLIVSYRNFTILHLRLQTSDIFWSQWEKLQIFGESLLLPEIPWTHAVLLLLLGKIVKTIIKTKLLWAIKRRAASFKNPSI